MKSVAASLMGSSPLTRGKPASGLGIPWGSGLIPAHAGKTMRRTRSRTKVGAHPRSRGENRVLTEVQLFGHWLIPAHAGKTDVTRARCCVTGAHPRSRGENTHPRLGIVGGRGSSPLTRGKPVETVGEVLDPGLIPAHAGKTTRGVLRARRAWAHPRSRGENFMAALDILTGAGSSPLTRGKQRRKQDERSDPGLIPAHAGKTCSRRTAGSSRRAHPRSRGENRS